MIDLELDERTINVDISNADQQILDVLTASTIDNLPGSEWRPRQGLPGGASACPYSQLADSGDW